MHDECTPDVPVFVPLSQGLFAVVDAVDAERVLRHKWFAWRHGRTYYAKANIAGTSVYMHRLILSAQKGTRIDHRSGDGWDNRRENLRNATQGQNVANQRRRSDNTSGFKGVKFFKRDSVWVAALQFEGKYVHIGRFPTAEEAARAYDAKAREVFGEFARTNF